MRSVRSVFSALLLGVAACEWAATRANPVPSNGHGIPKDWGFVVEPDSYTLHDDEHSPFAVRRVQLRAWAIAPNGERYAVHPEWHPTGFNVVVSPSGMAQAADPGETHVVAHSDGMRASSSINVLEGEADIVIIGHRGFAKLGPENTIETMRRAIAAGATSVEVDVRLTKDSAWVVMHDATVDRTTNGRGAVSSLTVPEISGLNACPRTAGMAAPCRVPTLDMVLSFVRDHRITVVIDIKSPLNAKSRNALLDAVTSNGLMDQVLFASFSRQDLTQIRSASVDARIGLLSSTLPDLTTLEPLGNVTVLVDVASTVQDAIFSEWMTRARDAAVTVGVWVVNDARSMQRLLSHGPVVLVCDTLLTP